MESKDADVPSAKPEAPPQSEDVEMLPDSPKKKWDAEPSDDPQPQTEACQKASASSSSAPRRQDVAVRDVTTAAITIPKPSRVDPEPTAVSTRSSQVEGNALGGRGMQPISYVAIGKAIEPDRIQLGP
jgi:hypothetical protein